MIENLLTRRWTLLKEVLTNQTSYFTSESVCAGHPDKLCDQISDAILDEALKQDPNSHTGVETMACANRLIIAGEVKSTAKLDYSKIAADQIRRLGYTEPKWGFSDRSPIEVYVHQQSPEIAVGVDAEGAGDQGMMFGFACQETPSFMPMPITLAHALTRAIDKARETKKLDYLRPDGKAQVVVRYEKDRPVAVEHVTVAVPHDEKIDVEKVKDEVYRKIVLPTLAKYEFAIDATRLVVNGTGIWHMPGPASDAGLTGRKIVVDTYGGYARVGGGAFSGKDPSKVDRSGAYAARYIAKNIVAAGLASKVEVGLSYYIGAKRPVMLSINTFGSSKVRASSIKDFADSLIEPSVRGIVNTLDLQRPIYLQTAAYGHFGKPDLSWEVLKS